MRRNFGELFDGLCSAGATALAAVHRDPLRPVVVGHSQYLLSERLAVACSTGVRLRNLGVLAVEASPDAVCSEQSRAENNFCPFTVLGIWRLLQYHQVFANVLAQAEE